MLKDLRAQLAIGGRVDDDELLDSGTLTTEEIDRNLADLRRMNRLPGGTGASEAAIRRLVPDRGELRVLDVGTGRGDMPVAFARRGWRTVGVDANPEVARIARRETLGTPEVEIIEADARSLPFDDGAFDVAHSSLLIHHLPADEAVRALRELARVSRRGVVVNDLRRGALPLAATWLSIVVLAGSRVTRHDGLVSARRAYTGAEMEWLLADAGLAVHWRSGSWLPRVAIAAVRA